MFFRLYSLVGLWVNLEDIKKQVVSIKEKMAIGISPPGLYNK